MRYTFFHFVLTCFILSNCSSITAQSNAISVTLLGNSLSNNDTAKCVFGLNRIRARIHRTDSDENSICLIAYRGSQYKIGHSNWVAMPLIDAFPADDYGTSISLEDTFLFDHDVKLYNLYYDENYSLNAFATTGGTIDYRLVFSSRKVGLPDTIICSPLIHVWVPPATPQDIEALQYMVQQKSNCPELSYFFADINALTLRCLYVYEYLDAHFPNSVLGIVAKHKIADYKCLAHNQQLESVPEVKAEIMNVRELLLASDIPFIRSLVGKTACMND